MEDRPQGLTTEERFRQALEEVRKNPPSPGEFREALRRSGAFSDCLEEAERVLPESLREPFIE